VVALLHRKTDGAGEQKCEGALAISRCPTRLNDGHRACRLTFWSMTPHILIQPVSPSHRESPEVLARSVVQSQHVAVRFVAMLWVPQRPDAHQVKAIVCSDKNQGASQASVKCFLIKGSGAVQAKIRLRVSRWLGSNVMIKLSRWRIRQDPDYSMRIGKCSSGGNC